MAAIEVTFDYIPLIYVRYQGLATPEEFEEYLEKVRVSLYAPAANKRILLLDAMHAAPMTPRQRQRQADWQKEHYAQIERLTLGAAFALPSMMIRGVLTAIFWLQTLPCPHQVFATTADAFAWCEARVNAAGMNVPPAARSLVA